MKHPLIAALMFSLATGVSVIPAAHAADKTPYVMNSTDVVDVRATRLNRDYQLFVSLPPSYEKSTRRYPVVFVTDADYAFPLIRSIAKRLGTGAHGVEEFILVGLSYAKGETSEYSRRRDYTPTDTVEQGRQSDMPGRLSKFGESEGYRRFIKDEVFPVIAQRYRADMDDVQAGQRRYALQHVGRHGGRLAGVRRSAEITQIPWPDDGHLGPRRRGSPVGRSGDYHAWTEMRAAVRKAIGSPP